MRDHKEQYEFPIPDGFNVPEGHEGGDKPFDVVCTLRAKPDGKTLCLLKIGETDTGYEKESGKKGEYKKDYSDMAKGMMAAMPEQTGGGGGGAGY